MSMKPERQNGIMAWNYLLAACLVILVFSVFKGYRFPAVFSGIALAGLIRSGGSRLVDRMKKVG